MNIKAGQIVVSTATSHKSVGKNGEYGLVMHANNTLAIVYWPNAGRCVKQFFKNATIAYAPSRTTFNTNINRDKAEAAYAQYKNDTKPAKRKQESEDNSQPSLNTPMGYAVALMRNDLSARELISMHDGLISSEQMYLRHVERVTGESASIHSAKIQLQKTLRAQELSEIDAEIKRLEQLKAQLANK
ncbi:hypothetical protein KVP40.0197 [Vibrio phage KVP40]|uniref:Uncharacterized protein n=3 Tax=Schizotequatrovirus KVP40 TaxID=1914019 RepID=Q6WHV7_BPKVM|nr:hypothetical protein KVP40.0197 [Vibrio phage KVP40]AAQ64266.1 hypothetical protein KVP40.0197 [Vibrio phage KVP40]AFN37427.1 hypothetical protein pp2_194 [Vibrio phage phi-pp2]QIW91216.1 hypothetical protein COHAPHLL_00380 [Vibrio phage V09]WOL24730.1 hypothetical protein [Vibrio phage PG216]